MLDFANKLKLLRNEQDITQKELADLLHVSQNAVYNWENGKREPNLEMIEQIANVLNTNVATLLFDETKSMKENLKNFPQDTPIDSFIDGVKLSPKQMLEANFVLNFSSKDYEFEELELIKQMAEYIKSIRTFGNYAQFSVEEMMDVLFRDFSKNKEEIKEFKEDLLLEQYRRLNNEGKNRVIEDIENLTYNPKYANPDKEQEHPD